MAKRVLMGCCLLLMPVVTSAQSVLHAVPLAVEAPGYHDVVRAFHDGTTFYVDIADLLERLKYKVSRSSAVVEALDASRRYLVDFAMETAVTKEAEISLAGETLLHGDHYLVTTTALARMVGSDIYFDEERLRLRLSTMAETFNVGALRQRLPLLGEAPGPLRFGRERPLVGGLLANYYLSWHRQYGIRGSAWFTGSFMGGAIRGRLGEANEISYLIDRPGSRFLTRIEAGRLRPTGKVMDAIRISNLPLVSRHLQRTGFFEGRTEPHALVEAVLSGVVVDRALADSEGEYRLSVPAQYGSAELLVRESPLGAAPPRLYRRYLFVPADLIEARHVYYDVHVGRAEHGWAALTQLQAGLLPQLTLRAAGRIDRLAREAQLGFLASPLSFLAVRADVGLPTGNGQAVAKLWRKHWSGEASYTHVQHPQKERHFRAQIAGAYGRLSGLLTASSSWMQDFWHLQQVTPSLSYHGQRGFHASFQATVQRYGPSKKALFYRSSAGQTVGSTRVVGRLSLFVRGHDKKAIQETGLEGLLSFRRISAGFSVGYDTQWDSFTGGLTLRMETAVGNLAAQHTHLALYGSVELSRQSAQLRGAPTESSAIIRIFEDKNADGNYDSHEPILRHVEAQLFHASLKRLPNGTLRAPFLESYATYQVQIMEGSIRDPLLKPATGYTFSFIADPGRTKIINIPLSRALLIKGSIENTDGPPTRLRILAFHQQEQVLTANVYRDGGFVLHLDPGRYTLRLLDVVTRQELATQNITIAPGSTVIPVVFNMSK